MTEDGTQERYQRESRIATGGMGEVWRARDSVLGREVAVKLLKREYADDPVFRARFEAEARHAAALHHPGIAQVFDYGVAQDAGSGGGTPYLVMELVDGKPLSELLAGGRALDPEAARDLIRQAADALAVAHAAGVVHRDVKPANLLVTPDRTVKVTDFGIARAADSVPITTTGQVIGTPHYLSPEQARGEAATAASDVYSLGVVLYECLAGQRPFSADTPVATALAHIRDEPPPLPDSVPDDLRGVVMQALAKDPSQRYADGAELAAALRGRVTRRPPVAAPVPPPAEPTRVLPAAAPPVTRTTTTTGPARDEPRRSSPWPWVVVLLLVAALALLLLATKPWAGDDQTPSGTTSPSRSARPTPTPSDTPTPSASPEQVTVDPDDYVGRPEDDVRRELEDLGLRTRTTKQDNDGSHEEGTVADLNPTGEVDEGQRIELLVWGPAPVEPTPSESATPTDSPGPGKGDGKGGGGKGGGGEKPKKTDKAAGGARLKGVRHR